MITEELLKAIATIESNNNPNAINSKTGAKGLYQFTPIAWKDVQENYRYLKDFDCAGYIFDPIISKVFAESLLKLNEIRLIKRYKEKYNLDLLLASYNWGIGNVLKYEIGKIPKETKDYIYKIKKLLMEDKTMTDLDKLYKDVQSICGELEVDIVAYKNRIKNVINECSNSEQARETAVTAIVDRFWDKISGELGFTGKLLNFLGVLKGLIHKLIIKFIK